jgi:hypothetical protein
MSAVNPACVAEFIRLQSMRIDNANTYGSLSESRLTAFETALGTRLPEHYREFLTRFNGGRWENRIFKISDEDGESEIHHVYGLHDGPEYCRLDRVWHTFRDRIPSSVLAIADDPGGNKICLGIQGNVRGKVFFWTHDHPGGSDQRSALSLISGSFDEFVGGLGLQPSDADKDEIGQLIKRDDKEGIAKLIESGAVDIEAEDDFGRTLIERATIAASPKIIGYLLGKGAHLRASLELARTNAEFFKEHQAIVSLLQRSRSN